MKKILSAVTICCLTVGLSAAPAFAQMNKKTENRLVRSEKILGADVYHNGNDIGEIKDVVFDENTGGMSRVVLAAGGFLGIGDQLTPVEWKKINAEPGQDGACKFTMQADKAELMKEKSFASDQWPDFSQGWASEKIEGKKLVRLSEANGAKLFDTNGTEIGGIQDLMIDARTGKVAYAVVSFSHEFINKGDKLTMVPWPLVRQSEKNTPGYVLKADKARLENAVYFDRNEWPNINDLAWNKTIYDHYQVAPYYWSGV